jgi:hypothetical protein
MNTDTISAADLRRAANIREKIEALQAELNTVLSGNAPRRGRGRKPAAATSAAAPAAKGAKGAKRGPKKGGKRNLSPEARERIRAAVAARWARAKAGKGK